MASGSGGWGRLVSINGTIRHSYYGKSGLCLDVSFSISWFSMLNYIFAWY